MVKTNFTKAYKYKYNGKELQDELGLNVTAMDFRMYDNALGRFHNIDKLAELAPMWTPYRFAFNNPVYWRDPTGLSEKGSNSLAICPTCPNNAKFKPAIDDPNREFEYDEELDIAIEVKELNNVEIVETRKTKTIKADNNSIDWAEYFNNAAGGFGTGLGFLENQGGYFYANRQFVTLSPGANSINEAIKINLKYTSKAFRTGNPFTFKPISASGVIGTGTIVSSVILEVPEVVEGFEKSNKEGVKQTAGAAGGILGGMWLGTKAGALAGTLQLGPYGTIIFGIVGGAFGAWAGEDATEALFDNIHNNSSFNGNFRAEPGLNGCFLAGTKVLMADGTEKAIENIVEGEFVMSYNFDLSKLEAKKVLEKISPIQNKIIEITFSNNIVNSNTVDHPYFVIGKGWVSFSPDDTFKKYGIRVGKLENGDKCYLFDNSKLIEIEVIDCKVISGEFRTFNLSKVEDNHNFFANRILVHNKYN